MTKGSDRLLTWAGHLGGSMARVSRLSATLLARPGHDDERLPTASQLNNDGSPLQVCAAYGPAGRKLRILAEPAAGMEPLDARLRLARQALSETLRLTHADSLAPSIATMLSFAWPSPGGLEALRAGFFWLAGGLDGGAAVYANTRWGNAEDRWHDARRWLGAILPRSDRAFALIDRIERATSLASVGIEGRGLADARAKLYWRMNQVMTFDDMELPALQQVSARARIESVVGDGSLSLSGVVLSASYRLSDGLLADVKADFCAHCLPRAPQEWVDVLDRCGVPTVDVAEGLLQRLCDVALVGIGATDDAPPRVNVYMKAPAG